MGGLVVGGLALLAGFGVQLVEMVLVGEGGTHGVHGGHDEAVGRSSDSDDDDHEDEQEDVEKRRILRPRRQINGESYGSLLSLNTISTTTATTNTTCSITTTTTTTSSSSDEDDEADTEIDSGDTDSESQYLQENRVSLSNQNQQQQQHHHHHRRRRHQSPAPPPSLPISILILESSIMFHSLIIGLTLGISPDANLKMLVIAMALHQFFEGVALGSLISTSTTAPSNLAAKPHKETKPTNSSISQCDSDSNESNEQKVCMTAWGLGMLYPLTTPLGILFGILIRCLHFLPSTPSSLTSSTTITTTSTSLSSLSSLSSSPSFMIPFHHGNTNGDGDSMDPESNNPTFKLMQGVLSSLSAGVLIYNVYTELLGTEVNHHRGFQKSSKWFKLVCLGSMYAGAWVLGLLGLWV
jgi:zinc transporter ZupT